MVNGEELMHRSLLLIQRLNRFRILYGHQDRRTIKAQSTLVQYDKERGYKPKKEKTLQQVMQ